MIRVGIVGYGWVAQAHIRSFNEIDGVEVAAVCSRRPLDPEELSARHGSRIRVFNDFQDMCRQPDLDVVSICTPHPFHPEQVEVAAAAGKHLVIEKPVAIDLDGVNRVEKAVRESGVKAVVCFEVKVVGHFQTVRDFIDLGLLGDIHYGECDYYHGIGPWYGQYEWNRKAAFGGSSLLTAGCHALDALLWLMGSRPVEVTAYATQSAAPAFAAYEYPTTTVTIMRFENGAVGKTASVIDCIQPYLLNLHLVGAKGAIWNDKFHTSSLSGLDSSDWSRFHTQMVGSGDVANQPYRVLFEDFIDALRQDRSPRFSFEDSILTHRVCLAADRSAAEGRPVRLEEMV
ncbi:MAG: Gfo/Idh/MocA family oxidoreductase [Acidobacteriota bacterium]